MNATATSAIKVAIAAALAFALSGLTPASSQEQAGRYTMSPIDGGFARLDTQTGAMSLCKALAKDTSGNAAWNCQPMGDEARKLETENKELRAEVKRMEDQLGLNGPKTPVPGELPTEPRPGGNKSAGPLNLPSEEEVDKALSYVERMVKKFHDTMKRIENNEKKGMPL